MSHPVVGVKICGVTCVDDALACAAAGADWIGLNFHPGSPRFDPAGSSRGDHRAPFPPSVSAVGVFVDRPAAEVADIAEQLGLTHRSVARTANHRKTSSHSVICRLIRAFRLKQASDWSGVTDYLAGRRRSVACPTRS